MATRIVPAVDGQELGAADMAAAVVQSLHSPTYPFVMSQNEVACFLSHRRAWQAIIDNNLDAALILEDDAALEDHFSASLNLAMRHIDAFGFIRFPFRNGRERGRKVAVDGSCALYELRDVGLGMVAQLVSRNAALQLLRATERFDRPVDTLLQMPWATGVRPCSIAPAAVREISPSLGGTTLRKSCSFSSKLNRELLRPLYRLQVRFYARLMRHPKPHTIGSAGLRMASEPPTSL